MLPSSGAKQKLLAVVSFVVNTMEDEVKPQNIKNFRKGINYLIMLYRDANFWKTEIGRICNGHQIMCA